MKVKVSGVLLSQQGLCRDTPVTLEVERCTLKEALELLSQKLGDRFERLIFEQDTRKVKSNLLFLVNGRSHWNLPGRWGYALQDGDEIVVTQIVSGG